MTKSVQEPSTPGRNIWTNVRTQDIDSASKPFIPPALPTRPIRREQLRQLVPLSDTTIYGLEMQGRFPRRFNLTNRCVAWDLAEVEAWVEQRRRESLASVVAKSPTPDVRLRRTRPLKAPGGQRAGIDLMMPLGIVGSKRRRSGTATMSDKRQQLTSARLQDETQIFRHKG